ncbi:MAG: hypothetical protein OEY49_07920 [Candidatus Heimdallarchaeota archaeon]|nr:hypothetical protein [Candidatus Heimdallarchaeota archaeon]
MVLFAGVANAWPADSIYVQETDTPPILDGNIEGTEWMTEEESFREDVADSGFRIRLTILRDSENLYVLAIVTTNGFNLESNKNFSIGIAFSDTNKAGMGNTLDRKVVSVNETGLTLYDLHNCINSVAGDCSGRNYAPGVLDLEEPEYNAALGFSDDGDAVFEFTFPLITDGVESLSDMEIKEGSYIQFIFNKNSDIMTNGGAGHGATATDRLEIAYEPRCFFCKPEEGMDTFAIVFNIFMAIIVMTIQFVLFSGVSSKQNAEKYWKIDVTKEMANNSILMDMAYYNSSFISIVVSGFFTMYSLIAVLYGSLWASWGISGYLINGIPTAFGLLTIFKLKKANYDPSKLEGGKPGISLDDAKNSKLIPVALLVVVLIMTTFIGLSVI